MAAIKSSLIKFKKNDFMRLNTYLEDYIAEGLNW